MKGGQGRRITRAQWEHLLESLKKGNTRRAACGTAGIHFTWFYDRLAADPTFAYAVTCAEDEAEAFYAGVIQQAAPDDWRAAESWLKRRRREQWGDSIDVRKLDDDQLVRLLEADARTRSGAETAADPTALANGAGHLAGEPA